MRQVSETIPEELAARVEAAVAWFNSAPESDGEAFKVTGILDADEALSGSDELQLILCGGDRCEQHAFRVTGSAILGLWHLRKAPQVNRMTGGKQTSTHLRVHGVIG